MERIRAGVILVVVAAALWWLYPGSAEQGPDDRIELTIWFNGPIEGRQLAVADAFEKRFPQYRVLLGSSAARSGLEGEGNPQRLMCGIAGGVPPDVVEYDRFAVCQWASRGAFLDLTPLIRNDLKLLNERKTELAVMETRKADPKAIAAQRAHFKALLAAAPTLPAVIYNSPYYGYSTKADLFFQLSCGGHVWRLVTHVQQPGGQLP